MTFLTFIKLNIEAMYDEYKSLQEKYMTMSESYSNLKAENYRLKEDLKNAVKKGRSCYGKNQKKAINTTARSN